MIASTSNLLSYVEKQNPSKQIKIEHRINTVSCLKLIGRRLKSRVLQGSTLSQPHQQTQLPENIVQHRAKRMPANNQKEQEHSKGTWAIALFNSDIASPL
uniref:Uncharacterized protein n=1 Tax=Nelumbo nucifera TaxID=4432 RepID=A0A822YL87_NELNU|nr:TPA_asm: hypothetical protein HUJ06_012201 [Nelumbo nucifera]